MNKIDITSLSKSPIELIGHDWMLVSAGNKDHYNTMTASWGGIGYLWNRAVAFIFVRPERYTFEFLEKFDTFTLSFFDEEYRKDLASCGKVSGRSTNKLEGTNLSLAITENGNPTFEQATLILECKKMYAQMLDAESFIDKEPLSKWYGEHGGMHKLFIGEIISAWKK